jgi:hypothetical protein
MPKYIGPSEIRSSGNAVQLDLPNYGNWQRIHNVVNVEYVIPNHKRPGSNSNWQPPALVLDKDGIPEFEVEAILDYRVQALSKRKQRHHGVLEMVTHYLVRWKGWTPEHDTWERVAHLANAPDLVRAYKAAHGLETSDYQ